MQFRLTTFLPRRLRVLVLAVLSAALLVAPFSQAQAVPTWQITTVDSAQNVGQYSSLKLDGAGLPVISYYDVYDVNNTAVTGNLKLARCADATCTPGNVSVQTLDTTGNVGKFTSLALDGTGKPVISYQNANNDLKLARCNDANCTPGNVTTQVVDSLGSVGQYSSLVLDGAGLPVISYYEAVDVNSPATTGNLKLARCSNANCTPGNVSIQTVDSTGIVGQFTSLALDGAGNPVISYYEDSDVNSPATTGNLKLVHCNDANCAGGDESIQTLDSTGNVGQFTSLALNSAGNPIISYYDVTNTNLKLARCSNANCTPGNVTTLTIDNAGALGSYTSLALDSAGRPVISYRDATTLPAAKLDLKLARCSEATCASGPVTIETVDGSDDVGQFTSLALDSAGLPVISYYDVTNGNLKLARQVETSVNVAPVATDQTVTTPEDTAANFNLTATDANGNPLTYSIVTQPAHGTVSGGTGAARTYTPNLNYFGPDSFTFKANDGTLDSNVATVNITVNAVNDAPLATNVSASTPQDTPVNINLTASDVEGNPLTYSVVTGPAHGTVSSGTGSARTYTPAAGYVGADSFTFKANDGTADSNVATVNINVTAIANVPPVANDQSVPTAEDTPVNIILTASDANGNSLSYSIVTQPQHGTLSGAGAAQTYTPNLNYFGPDSFTFKANDGQADSNVATVTINVTAVNDAPVAANQSVSTPEDTALVINLTATDVDGNPLTYGIVAQPQHGTLSGAGAAQTYTPNANYAGPDSFTFKANDGTADSNVATVTINVTAVNDAPVATDVSASTAEGLPVNVTLTATDVDGDSLSYTVVTGPAHGVLSGTGAVVTYTPVAGYTGLDTFTFQATDGQVDSNVATATINVGAANNAPVADDQSVATAEDAAVNITLTATDGDGNPLSYSVVAQPTHGTLSGAAPNVTYTPAANFSGTDSFTFKANDGLADSNVATVTIVVNAVNDTPVANNQTVATAEDTAVNITLTASDVDGDALTYEVVTPPQHGTLQGGGSALTYTPAANFFGTDTFTFKANDGQVDSNLATVTIQVSAVNDAPVASNQTVDAVSGQPVNITLAATDAEGSALTYTVVAAPQHGTLTGSGANLVYTPAADFTGNDQLTFRASDGQATSNVATVAIKVSAGPGGTGSKNVYLPLVHP
ncbi:MAG: Ig-like domain-containing protein [Caldilineaceae bacterium]